MNNKFTRIVLPGLLLYGCLVGVNSAWAAAGSLDPTFGIGGVTITSFASSGFVIPDSIQLQSGGKILVLVQAGNLSNEVLRYTTTGALDTSFGHNGVAVLSPGRREYGVTGERADCGSRGGHEQEHRWA